MHYSIHWELVGFLRVKIRQVTNINKATDIVMISLSKEYDDTTLDIPPIHMLSINNGRIYFTMNTHPLPILIYLELEFKKSIRFSALKIQAKSMHSSTIQNRPEI